MAKTVFQVSPDGGTTKYDIRDTNIAPVELSSTASQAYAKGKQFVLDSDGLLYEATGAISQGDTFVIYPTTNYNCKLADSVTDQIKDKTNKTDIARVEDGATASAEITKGTEFYHNSVLYKATTTISQGSAIVTSGSGQNCELAPTVTEQIQSGVESAYQLVEDTVGWSGKNHYVPIRDKGFTWSNNGVSFSVNDDYSVSIDGSPETENDVTLYIGNVILDGVNDYIVNGGYSEYCVLRLGIKGNASDTWGTYYARGYGDISIPKNVSAPYGMSVNAVVMPSYSGNHKVYPMAKKSSIIDSAYEPYHATVDEQKCDNTVIAPVENGSTASQAYAVGEHFIRDGAFCTCKQAISQGGSFTLNTNYTAGDVATTFTPKKKSITGNTSATGNLTFGTAIPSDAIILYARVTNGGNQYGSIAVPYVNLNDNNIVIHIMNPDGTNLGATEVTVDVFYY